MADLPQTVQEYRDQYTKEYPDLIKVPDEEIAKKVYLTGQKTGDLKGKTFEDFNMDFLPHLPENSVESYRKTYQKDFPELKNITDVEIANKVYEQKFKVGTKMPFSKFANKFAPRDYNNEYNQDSTDALGNIIGSNESVKQQVRPNYTTTEIAKVAGVDLPNDVTDNTSSFNGPKFAGSFAQNENNKFLAYKNSLSKFFNQDVDVRVGPKTGEIEFFNPITKKYTLTNHEGLDAGDIASFAGDALVVIPQVVGSIYGSAIGPAGAIAGGSLAAGLGEALRVQLGRTLFDINQDVSPLWEGTKQAAFTVPFEAAGAYAGPAKKWLENWIKTGRTDFAEIERLTKNASEAKVVFDKINEGMAAEGLPKKLQYTLGQASNDPRLLAVQSAFESDPQFGKTKFYNTWNRNNAEALDAYFGVLNKDITNPAITQDVVGKKISDVMQQNLEPKRQALAAAQAKAEADLTEVSLNLPSGIQKEAGESIRSTIQHLQDSVKYDFDKKYDALFNLGKDKQVKTDLIKQAMSEIDERQKNTLFTKYPDIYKIVKAPEGDTVDILKLKNTISDLKAADRAARTADISETPIEGAYKKILGAMDSQLRKDLPKTDPWLVEYKKISTDYNDYKSKFNGVIKDLLKFENGKLKLADEDVFETTFKFGRGSREKIDSVHDVIWHSPEAMTAYRDSILDFYKKKVVDQNTGLVNSIAHDKFVKNYEYPLKVFFGENNYGDISKIGGLAKAVEEKATIKNNVLKELADSTEGRIEKLDPDLIVNKVYNPKQPTQLKDVVNILKKDPETLKSFQDVVKKDLQGGIRNANNEFDFVKFNKYINENEQNLKTVFFDNPKYINNLKDLNKALQILSRKSPQGADVNTWANSALNDYIRMRVGMFTPEGRVFTMVKKVIGWRKMNQMQKLLTNPDEVERLMSLKHLDIPVAKDYGPTVTKNLSPLDEQKFRKNVQAYNAIVGGLFGDSIDQNDYFGKAPRREEPRKKTVERLRGMKPTIEFQQENIKPTISKPISQGPTSPNVDIFKAGTPAPKVASAPAAPAAQGQPQAPTNNLTSIPQDQLNKYSTLFGPVV